MNEAERLNPVLSLAVNEHLKTVYKQAHLLSTIEGRTDCQLQFFHSFRLESAN
jgi:hypothetical protein